MLNILIEYFSRSSNLPTVFSVKLSNPFLSISFEALQSDELFDIAVDLVCQIIHESGGIPESMSLIEQIYPRLSPLRDSLKRAMLDEDDDRVRGYCRIFTQAGESYIQLIVQHSEADIKRGRTLSQEQVFERIEKLIEDEDRRKVGHAG